MQFLEQNMKKFQNLPEHKFHFKKPVNKSFEDTGHKKTQFFLNIRVLYILQTYYVYFT